MILKRIKILENQLFESLANARKLYSNKIEPSIFEQLISIDISKTYKYIEKICKFYLQNEDIDLDELKSDIELFDRLSSKNLIDIKDINQFKIYSSFKEYLDSNSDKMSKSEEQRLLKNKGTETILNNENVLVLLIKDEQAAIQYGSNTKWCISATDSKNYFKSYRGKRVTFYFIFNKELDSSNPNYKIAVAVNYSGKLECYNAIDKKIRNSILSKLGLSEKLFKVKELPEQEDLVNCIKGTYKINFRGLIDVDGDVDLNNKKLNSILDIGNFGIVTGDFDCSHNNLTSLEGCPIQIGGYFNCGFCVLTSLKYAPIYVGGKFSCYFNKKKFTVKDVVKVCDVKGEINV